LETLKAEARVPYRYLEDAAPADVAFEASGSTLEEAFRSSADAELGVMVESPEAISSHVTRSFKAEEDSLDILLLQLLQEIIYYKDAERLLLRCARARIQPRAGGWTLSAELAGEPIDEKRHALLTDVKAVTLHLLKVERTPEGWMARAVLDI
jgi:SHS2 domain-containing protein